MNAEKEHQQPKPLKCQRCGHEWEYKGKSKWYTSCPKCRTSVKVGQKEE